ncbi:hypothetical protein F4778DRAFT_528813 [Xylariomycetidae sp. FL2044]|nr:hypothetical protein F4778DRAFT_528813 [Xylariomycetidae sp. FL2044]
MQLNPDFPINFNAVLHGDFTMSSITQTQRELGWNIRLFLGSGINSSFAGFYQQDDFLTVGRVCRDIDLCFTSPDNAWSRALLDQKTGSIIVLSVDDTSIFPTPPPREHRNYYYVFHNPTCANEAKPHGLESSCITLAERPQQRFDNRYLPIGYEPSDGVLRTVPLRGKKRPRTPSASPKRSISPPKGTHDAGVEDDFPESIISEEEARPIINEFCKSILAAGQTRCAISQKGGAWWPGGGIGMVMEAAHIVPQVHWSKYPTRDQGVADLHDRLALKDAWEATWHMSNGLLLSIHIHRLFDARLISIDPTTRRIRVFMPCDFISEYHGREAILPEDVSMSAIRHHYDMCCIENMSAKRRPTVTSLLFKKVSKTSLAAKSQMPSPKKDPPKSQPPMQDPRTGDKEPQEGDNQGGSQEATSLLPSPPASERGSWPHLWRSGSLWFTDEQEVQQMREKGWLVYKVDNNELEEEEEGEEEERGRPRKRPCRSKVEGQYR